jgi:hypothetical protein
MRSATRYMMMGLLIGVLTACSSEREESDVVVATPHAITIKTSRLGDEPIGQAEAYCAQFGRKAVARGGVKLGDPAYNIMWGFDCVDK